MNVTTLAWYRDPLGVEGSFLAVDVEDALQMGSETLKRVIGMVVFDRSYLSICDFSTVK